MNQTLNQTLDDLGAYNQLIEEYASQHDGEISDELAEWETEFLDKLIAKVDRTASFMQNTKKQIEIAKENIELEKKKQKHLETILKKTEARIKWTMETNEIKVLKGDKRSIAIQGNGGVAPLKIAPEFEPKEVQYKVPVAGKQYPSEILTTVTVIDKEKLREFAESFEADENGLTVKGDLAFRIGERGTRVVVK